MKNKKNQKIETTTAVPTFDASPYFYAVNANKYKNSEESVKPYLKFVKNITITYPVIIPARDNVKRKPQKQKEKSRDVNSNRNINHFTAKPTTVMTSRGNKTTGNLALTLTFVVTFFILHVLGGRVFFFWFLHVVFLRLATNFWLCAEILFNRKSSCAEFLTHAPNIRCKRILLPFF